MDERSRDDQGQEDTPAIQVTDRRFWARDRESADSAKPTAPGLPSFVEQLKARTEAAERKLRERIEEIEAENQSFRSRLSKELEKRWERERVRFFQEFLEVIDNFERALSAVDSGIALEDFKHGLALNLELMLKKLSLEGVAPLEVEGRLFDPHTAEALGQVDVDDAAQDRIVVEVLQKGYRCGEDLLRPALVRVGRFRPR